MPEKTKRPRLRAESRKEAILAAVLPLFARHGLAGVSSRELAAACGVSQALIFRHFPSKEALFAEILARYETRIEPVIVGLARSLDPTTRHLVQLVFMFIRLVAIREPALGDPTIHLYYRSFTEDGLFARRFLDRLVPALRASFEASLREARKQGDARDNGIPPENLFWFVQHLATASCLVRLQSPPVIRYRGRIDKNVEEMTRFALAGLGLTEAAIRRHATAEAFAAWRKLETASPAAANVHVCHGGSRRRKFGKT